MFLDRMKIGSCYELRTPWGRELVRVLNLEADCVAGRSLADGRELLIRGEAVLAYAEIPSQGDEPVARAEEPVVAAVPRASEAPRKNDQPTNVAPARVLPERRPSVLENTAPGERLTGRITLYFNPPQAGVGNGYIELARRADAPAGERSERVFFHIRQVREKKLSDFLCALPRLPDYNGRPRGFALPQSVEVTFELADNRAHSRVSRPVAGDIRLTENSLAQLQTMVASEYRYIQTSTAFVDGYRFSQDSDLLVSLSVQANEDKTFTALLDGSDIADPRLRRFLMESRPRVPDDVSLRVDLFRRWAAGRPVGPMLAAHAALSGDAPWSERDEMRWNDMFTEDDLKQWTLVREGRHNARVFALTAADAVAEEAVEVSETPDSLEESSYYDALPLWKGAEAED